MTVIEFVQANLPLDNPLVGSVAFCLITLIIHDFYHCFFSAILSWFKKN